jgi:hypothetical protein
MALSRRKMCRYHAETATARPVRGGACPVLLGLLLLVGPRTAPAADVIPFAVRDMSPLILIHGLPTSGTATVLPRGEAEIRWTFDLANNFSNGVNAREQLFFDGESSCLTLALRRGIGHRAEVGIELPLVTVSGGVADGSIERFHQALGLPNGGRALEPRNRLLLYYRKGHDVLLRMEDSAAGPGDLRLTAGWQAVGSGASPTGSLALRAALQLPTGDPDRLLGSGAPELAVWGVGSRDFAIPVGRLTIFGSAGMVLMATGPVLREMQQPLAGFATLGAGWAPAEWIAFKLQVDTHTPLYRGSSLEQLGAVAAQLTSGGTLALGKGTSLDIGVIEDIAVETAPDVVFHFSLRRVF